MKSIKIWIGNIPYSWDKVDLWRYIDANTLGENVFTTDIELDDRARSRGFGVITAPESMQDEILALNGNTLAEGRRVFVRIYSDDQSGNRRKGSH